MSIEETVSTQRIYEGRVINLRVDTIKLPDGSLMKKEIVEHGGAVVIVAIDGDDNVLLVRQYRKAADETLLELPAGGIDHGEKPEDCVVRELQEETGYTAKTIRSLGGYYSAPGFCSEYLHLYIASDLLPSKLEADEDEIIEVEKVPFNNAVELVTSGEIHDAKSVAGILRVHLLRQQIG